MRGRSGIGLCLAGAVGALLSGSAMAACVSPTAGAPQSAVDRVLASPSALLERFPEGQGGLIAEIRNVVATNPTALAPIAGLIKSANADQRRAIGAGLGQAAAMCARSEPETGRRIQEAILAADSREVSLAFQAVVGDRPTAAVGPGSSSASSGGLGGGGLATQSASSSTGSSPYSYSSPAVANTSGTPTTGGSSVSLTSPTTTVGSGSGSSSSDPSTSTIPSIVIVSNNTNSNVNNVSATSSSSSSSTSSSCVQSVSPFKGC